MTDPVVKGWAGSRIVSRGRSYQRGGSVRDLACTESGGLVAWVSGTFALGYVGNVYELSEPYAPKRYRVAAVREVGTNTEGGATIHFYEVEFNPEEG